MSDPNLIVEDNGSEKQTNRLVCMYAETVFQDEQTLRRIPAVLVFLSQFCLALVVHFLLLSVASSWE